MANIKLLELKSEIGAGTHGSSLGVDALKTVGFNRENDLFYRFPHEEIPNENHQIFHPASCVYAKHIEGIVELYKRLSEKVSQSMLKGQFPVVLSGDHATAGGTIAGIKKAFPQKKLGIIWVDAHADLHTPYTTPSGNIHGMSLSTALNVDNLPHKKNTPDKHTIKLWEHLKNIGNIAPKVLPKDVVIIGLRDYEKEEAALINKYGISIFTVDKVRKNSATQVAQLALKQLLNCDLIYLSFDVDCLDPSLSTGTGTPVENGFTKEEAENLITTLLQDNRSCCFEITEINPTLDTQNKMAEMAFDILVKGIEVLR